MSGDYKPNYQSSPNRKRLPVQNKDQASIYKYQTPSALNLYNNTINNNTNNNSNNHLLNNNNSNSSYLYDSSKQYSNQLNIRNNNNTNSSNTISSKQTSSSYSINNRVDYNNNDDDIEDDLDINYSNNLSNTNTSSSTNTLHNRFNNSNNTNNNNNNNNNNKNTNNNNSNNNSNDDSYIDYSTDENPRKLKQPQPLYNHLNNQIQQQHRDNSKTTIKRSQQQQQQQQQIDGDNSNRNIISKIIIEPWEKFYYGSNKSLWPFERNNNSNNNSNNVNFKQGVWIFIFSALFVCGLLGFFATKYHGIDVYLPFSSSTTLPFNSTTNNNNIQLSNLITKEQLYPMFDEYFKKNEILKSYSKLFEKIENDIKFLSEREQYKDIINEIKEEVRLVKLSNMDEERVNQLIAKMINHYNNNENNKEELKELLLKSIKDLTQLKSDSSDQLIQIRTDSMSQLDQHSTESINKFQSKLSSLSKEEQTKIEKEFHHQFNQLNKNADELISKHSSKIEKLADEINVSQQSSLLKLNKEYKQLEDRLKEFSNKLQQSISSSSLDHFESSKLAFIKEMEERINKESSKLTNQYIQVNQQFSKIQQFINENPSIDKLTNTIESLEAIKLLIEDILEVYSADKIAKADYALGLAGASIEYNSPHYRVSETYPPTKSGVNGGSDGNTLSSYYHLATNWIFPQPKPNPPETILDPLVNTGSCWGFYSGNGTVVIRLAKKIAITEVTMEHVNSNISHHIDSAPKEFQVFGLVNSTDIGQSLGIFTYDTSINRHLQTFKVNTIHINLDQNDIQKEQEDKLQEFSHVALRILSNHGYRYTCLYRFRVHGYQISHPEEEQLLIIQEEQSFKQEQQEEINQQTEQNQQKVSNDEL
ncbi:hypothetical protein RB653_010259 [Dictyostelium firmibasis]|uniref:SUN domain-containing protein n=1 Tax=Dictyostelium firmibasis TaxID=79012 RepID=A0AAN7TLJ4_9MYCE